MGVNAAILSLARIFSNLRPLDPIDVIRTFAKQNSSIYYCPIYRDRP